MTQQNKKQRLYARTRTRSRDILAFKNALTEHFSLLSNAEHLAPIKQHSVTNFVQTTADFTPRTNPVIVLLLIKQLWKLNLPTSKKKRIK